MGGGGGGGGAEEEEEDELLLDEEEDEDAGCGGARLGSGPRVSIEWAGSVGGEGRVREFVGRCCAYFSAHRIFAIAGTRGARRAEIGRGAG